MTIRAVILAAGIGRRLGSERPKCLLEFAGQSLLQRHFEILISLGIDEIVIGLGHRAAEIEAALNACNISARVSLVYNPDYTQGSIVTLWHLRERLATGDDILLMDADVLYDYRMITRLLESEHRNCFLLDRELEAGEEPVKLCVRDGRLVEFRKHVEVACDYCGESVGFFRLSSEIVGKLTCTAARYIRAARLDEPYEEALRDVLLAEPEVFGFEDITGLPWIEIDFPQDVERARTQITPLLMQHAD